MINRLLEALTGKDDVERVAASEDLRALNRYLKTRKLFIPRKPSRFLEAATLKEDELIKLISEEAQRARDAFEPWIIDNDGKRHLPAFSSQRRMEQFQQRMSKELKKVFVCGVGEILLDDIGEKLEVDVVDLNLFCARSWQIVIRGKRT